MKRDNINIFESYVDTLYDSNYELVPMADFESYKVFGAIERRFPEYIKNTFIAVKPKLFNNVSFLSFGEDSIYNPTIIVNGQPFLNSGLRTITYKYKHQKYAVVSFNKILPQYKCGIIREITGDNEIYSISDKYNDFIKYHFFTDIVWRGSCYSDIYDAGYRILPPEYVFEHFNEFCASDKNRFNEVFRFGSISKMGIKHPIQKASYNDKVRFAKRYLKAIVKLKTEYTNETC